MHCIVETHSSIYMYAPLHYLVNKLCTVMQSTIKNSLQPISSLPSAQLDTPLHRLLADTHCPLEHRNWLGVQTVVSEY